MLRKKAEMQSYVHQRIAIREECRRSDPIKRISSDSLLVPPRLIGWSTAQCIVGLSRRNRKARRSGEYQFSEYLCR
ncbi:hypothetical protein CEXT_476921 [Caerostris extrusa]|uniref:Ribosomal protein S14 n=1 Tax=Caerostris extrusa TaxID=172846 RepID=A0AAV4X5M7_CAEEX|nr:hypothetical protein CEXT_476921 [Caerostris extrusa]